MGGVGRIGIETGMGLCDEAGSNNEEGTVIKLCSRYSPGTDPRSIVGGLFVFEGVLVGGLGAVLLA